MKIFFSLLFSISFLFSTEIKDIKLQSVSLNKYIVTKNFYNKNNKSFKNDSNIIFKLMNFNNDIYQKNLSNKLKNKPYNKYNLSMSLKNYYYLKSLWKRVIINKPKLPSEDILKKEVLKRYYEKHDLSAIKSKINYNLNMTNQSLVIKNQFLTNHYYYEYVIWKNVYLRTVNKSSIWNLFGTLDYFFE